MDMIDNYRLTETAPAEVFADSHLLGNGALGASVTGGIPYETILINHDTLWSGQENDKLSRGTLENFLEARRLTLAGQVKAATTLINDEMLGYWSESFLPLGYLNLTVGLSGDRRTMPQKRILENEFPATNYRRTLTLGDAVERIEYEQRGRRYTREMFVSHPDNVLAVRMTATGGTLDFALSVDSPLRHEQRLSDGGAAVLGRAPDRVEPYGPCYTPNVVYREDSVSNAIRFAATARIAATDGDVYHDEMRVYVANASYAVVLLSAGTNFHGAGVPRDRDAAAVLTACERIVRAAAEKGWDALLRDHIADYQALYGRVSIRLGEELTGAMSTTARMLALKNIDDPSFSALVAQYARYLLIASSRPGTEASNLQGIWNPLVYPSWACNYTTNINVQMNYWPAEVLGLSECHLPMLELVRGCADAGRKAAQILYGMGGWVTHHNTDLWRFAALAGEDASWAWWPFGGFWMCQHLWAHYAYTLDEDFLREVAYPVLRGAAEFLCDFVVKDENGLYVTAPSTSPENKFFIEGASLRTALDEVHAANRFSPSRPDTAEVCKAATMDIAIIRELFGNLDTAMCILGIEDGIQHRMQEITDALTPFRIGKHGQLQEWDEDYEECQPGMGHLSNLYPVYPGDLITEEADPALFEAARVSLERRFRHGAGGSGWPGAWQICLWARFGDTAKCNQISAMMPAALGASMLTKGSLQIDAISGWGAGIAEMLLQSHHGKIELLPAIPASWIEGEIKGLCARGGFIVDMCWRGGKLTAASITAKKGGSCIVAYHGHSVTLEIAPASTVRLDGALHMDDSGL